MTDNKKNTLQSDFDRNAITWDGIKQLQLEDALKTSYAQRLAWLEESLKLAWAAKNSKRK